MTTENRRELEELVEKLMGETGSPEEFGRVMAQELAIANLIAAFCDRFPHHTPESISPASTRAVVARYGEPGIEEIVANSFTDSWKRINLIAGGAAS